MTPSVPIAFNRQHKRRRKAPNIGALHKQGNAWRLVVVTPGLDGASLAVATTLDGAGLANLPATLAAAKVGILVRVAPGSQCIAKFDTAPKGTGPEAFVALSLLAEAALPEDAPAHRRAVGVVRTPAGHTALLTTWRGAGEALACAMGDDIDECWTTEPAALAVLAAGSSVDAISSDRTTGGIVAFSTSPDSSSLRCLRADNSSADRWNAQLAGVGATHSNSSSGLWWRPDAQWSVARVCKGARQDSEWLSQFGVALGAAVAAASTDAFVASLALMHDTEDTGKEAIWTTFAGWLSRPRVATTVIAASIALVVLTPLAMAAARHSILTSKSSALGDARKLRADLGREAALYKQLEESRWPMTKLLADIANATPKGVVVESLTLEKDGNQGLTMKGRADDGTVLSALQLNLNATGILSGVQVASVGAESSGVDFTIQAKITSPRVPSKSKDDFAKETLQARLYANGASPPAAYEPDAEPSGTSASDTDTARPSATSGGGNRSRDRNLQGDRSTSTEATKAAAPPKIPPPITDEQIAAMDRTTAMKEWVARKTASTHSGTPQEDKDRLVAEAVKAKARMDALLAGGGQ